MFKKILSIILCTLLCGAQFTFANAENNISVYIDGTKIEFDVNPILVDGRTLVPMRAIFEAMGADVLWDNNTSTVTATKSDTIINLSIGSNVVFKNGTPIAIDVPAQLVNGRTLVPVRAVSESFDCNVDWIGETNTVVIASNYSTFGTLYNVLGNRAYEGELKNGQPHGIGTSFFEDGYTISYHGEFKNGEPCGKGIMYYEDGKKYIEGDIPSGTGKFYSETTGELFYEGEYVDLLLNGIGTMYFDDGSYYIGEFKNNLLHGKGTLYSKDGIAIANKVFENNELISYIDLGYNAEYDELMEWANEEYDKIYAEAEKVYKRAYQEAYDYYYYLLCGHITASGSDTFAAANAQRQIKAILPQVEDAARKEAELAEKEYLAETLEKFAAFLESEVEALNDKYNIK